MSYLPTTRAARGRALGFTPDEEKEILISSREGGTKLDDMQRILREQERLKLVSTIAAVGGAVYALGRLGELIASFRDRRKHVHL